MKRVIITFSLIILSFGCFCQEVVGKLDTAFFTKNDILFETQIIDIKYITNRAGAEIKRLPNINSKTIETYSYGCQLEVIENLKDWVGVKERIHQKIKNSKGDFERWAWEKVYIRKKDIGRFEDICLKDSDFYVAGEYDDDGYKSIDAGKFYKFELISKEEFYDNLKNKVDFVVYDTLVHIKENGKLRLKTEQKDIELVDIVFDYNDTNSNVEFDYTSEIEHYYEGQIPELNKYVVKRMLYEYEDNLFIDKTTGETIRTNHNTYVSSDKKHIICIYIDPYDMVSRIQLFRIEDNKFFLINELVFSNFMIPFDRDINYFSRDNILYMRVNSPSIYFTKDGDLNRNFQYVKLKIIE